jgi:hypothetical protein
MQVHMQHHKLHINRQLLWYANSAKLGAAKECAVVGTFENSSIRITTEAIYCNTFVAAVQLVNTIELEMHYAMT